MNKYLIALIVLGVSIAIFAPIFIFLFYRRFQFNKIYKKFLNWEIKLETETNWRTTTIRRFMVLGKNQPKLNLRCDMLKKEHELCEELKYKIKDYLDQLYILYKKYDLKKIKLLDQKYKNVFDNYLKRSKEFHRIDDDVNYNWEIIEQEANFSYQILNSIQNYLEDNKEYLPHSFAEMYAKVKEFRFEVTRLEEEKTTKNIAQVTIEMSENKRKILNFCKKVAKLKQFEYLLYTHIANEIFELKNEFSTADPEFLEVLKSYKQLCDNWIKLHYQIVMNYLEELLGLIKKLKFKKIRNLTSQTTVAQITHQVGVYVAQLETQLQNSKHNFGEKNFNKILQNFTNFKVFITTMSQKTNYSLQDETNLLTFLYELKNFVYKINYFKNYEKIKICSYSNLMNYVQISYGVYLYACSNFKYLEQSAQNKLIFQQTQQAQRDFDDLFEKLVNPETKNVEMIYNSQVWKEKEKTLINFFKLTFKPYFYHSMAKYLIKNSYLIRAQNEKFQQLVVEANAHLQSSNHQEAYRLLALYLKKERKNVQQNSH
ncbi:hypothetical protein [Mycoplasmopsis columbinasalis]|uniref:Uncharacterized protein n=1 Tax=Mycoplasmopsis columbinasalis TaxID=114880 RepID=A0A449B9H7_9BACT|nr:hypothetical protein [Mycoplasmopsis columbinasalis]VEU77815.1 Uncharacterised protein [Mycoplasmopsis columbinasalis]